MDEYLTLLGQLFGDDFNSPGRGLPLFPTRGWQTMTKALVVEAYQHTIALTGEPLQRADGEGRLRDRFGGHVCRVIGAAWLYSTLGDIYLVQLFARWGSSAIFWYIQETRLKSQHRFAARTMNARSHAEQVSKAISGARGVSLQQDASNIEDVVHRVLKETLPGLGGQDSPLLKELFGKVAQLEQHFKEFESGPTFVRNAKSTKSLHGCIHMFLIGVS